MANIGIKELTVGNWLVPDEVSTCFVNLLPDGSIKPITGEMYAEVILSIKLKEGVPVEIHKLFEVAKGAMLYGFLFYPLFTLGMEQICRVAETAISHICNKKQAPKRIRDFKDKIDWLVKNSVISETDRSFWEFVRMHRNFSSHPKMQTILAPGRNIEIIRSIASRINSLLG